MTADEFNKIYFVLSEIRKYEMEAGVNKTEFSFAHQIYNHYRTLEFVYHHCAYLLQQTLDALVTEKKT